MSSNAQILSTYLCTGLAEWFKQNTYFGETFKTIVDYARTDFPVAEMPGLAVYFMDSPSLERNSWNEVGKIAVDVVFSLGAQRNERAAEIITVLETLRANLLNNPVYAQQYISENYVPGLVRFGVSTNFANLGQLKSKMMDRRNSSLVITFSIVYEISVLLNQRAAWRNNKDLYSPQTDVYHEVQGINEVEVILKEQS